MDDTRGAEGRRPILHSTETPLPKGRQAFRGQKHRTRSIAHIEALDSTSSRGGGKIAKQPRKMGVVDSTRTSPGVPTPLVLNTGQGFVMKIEPL